MEYYWLNAKTTCHTCYQVRKPGISYYEFSGIFTRSVDSARKQRYVHMEISRVFLQRRHFRFARINMILYEYIYVPAAMYQ